VNSTFDTTTPNYGYDGDISCEVTATNSAKFNFISYCLNKADLFTVLNFDVPMYNPPYINLYSAARLYTDAFEWSVDYRFGGANTNEMHYMTHVLKADISSNWGIGSTGAPFRVFKFFPDTSSTYNYVNQCSNRGVCAQDTGLCTCFPGYTNDDCSVQNSIAV
jgi:hypothetical protein